MLSFSVHLPVSDLRNSRKFYEDKLRLHASFGAAAMADVAETGLVLDETEDGNVDHGEHNS